MKRAGLLIASSLLALLFALQGMAQTSGPLTIQEQGSFFVGGDTKSISVPASMGGLIPAQTGEITVNQMYVQYQIPVHGGRHVPVVFVHGCCLSSKTWETTPDGRMGWSEYFVRRGRSVYLADQVSRARSGFDPSGFIDAGSDPHAKAPSILEATREFAWSVFRFGPKFGEAYADEQFPIQAVNELYKQMIPDLNSTLPENPNPTWTQMAALGVKLKGAVLVGHSESGFFPENAALIDATGIRGMVTIETRCDTDLPANQIATLAKIPTVVMFGDHLADVSKPFSWMEALKSCETFVDQLKKAGGDATTMYLPALGIKGNSHMLMQDKNSNQLADLLIAWIDAHVESHKGAAH